MERNFYEDERGWNGSFAEMDGMEKKLHRDGRVWKSHLRGRVGVILSSCRSLLHGTAAVAISLGLNVLQECSKSILVIKR